MAESRKPTAIEDLLNLTHEEREELELQRQAQRREQILKQQEEARRRDWQTIINASLLQAAEIGDQDECEQLIEAGADVNTMRDDDKSTPLIVAAENAHWNVVRALLAHRVYVRRQNIHNLSALNFAVAAAQFDICQLLIAKGAEAAILHNNRPLIFDALEGDASDEEVIAVAKLLIANHMSIGLMCEDGNVLHCAARNNRSQVGTFLLDECHFPINSPEPQSGDTALHIAVREGNVEFCRMLRERGAASDIPNSDSAGSKTAEQLARESGKDEILQIFLQQHGEADQIRFEKIMVGNGFHSKSGQYDETEVLKMLFSSLKDDNEEDSLLLLRYLTKFDIMDKNQNNLLHLAAQHEMPALTRELLKRGVDSSAKNKRGETPFHVAALAEDEEICQVFIDAGVRPDLLDDKGQTVISVAAQLFNEEVLRTVLKAADATMIDIPDKAGRTALHHAAGKGKMTKILKEAVSSLPSTAPHAVQAAATGAHDDRGRS